MTMEMGEGRFGFPSGGTTPHELLGINCDRCLLIQSVIEANIPAWWQAQAPFAFSGYWTMAAKYFAESILGVAPTLHGAVDANGAFIPPAMPTEAKPPPLLYTKWRIAGTFERLKKLIVDPRWLGGEMAGAQVLLKQRPSGCALCGTKPHHRNHVQREQCPVCGCRTINTLAEYE